MNEAYVFQILQYNLNPMLDLDEVFLRNAIRKIFDYFLFLHFLLK